MNRIYQILKEPLVQKALIDFLHYLLISYFILVISLPKTLTCIAIGGGLFIVFCFVLVRKFKRSSHLITDQFPGFKSIRNEYLEVGIFIKTYPIIIGISFAILGNRIVDSTKVFFGFSQLNNFGIDYLVILFWALSIFWIFLFPRYFKSEERANSKRISQILNAVHNSPDQKLMEWYPGFHKKIMLDLKNESGMNNLETIAEECQILLGGITEIVKYFSPYDDDLEKIGANVWLLFNILDQKIYDSLPETLSFGTSFKGGIKNIGIIVLIKELILDINNGKENVVNYQFDKPIILPIPEKHFIGDAKVALPGAPWAALTGISLYNDITTIKHDLKDMSAPIRNDIMGYFDKPQNGNHIKSFVSLRLGDETNPIGVLNIDSRSPNILGDKQFIKTFLALLEPFKYELGKRIEQYAKQLVEKEPFPWSN